MNILVHFSFYLFGSLSLACYVSLGLFFNFRLFPSHPENLLVIQELLISLHDRHLEGLLHGARELQTGLSGETF